MKNIGICAHSYEGGSLCFLTACKEGSKLLGSHMHPKIIMSAVPMGLSMSAWENGKYSDIEKYLAEGVEQVKNGGAHFFICPDNTAHIVLENIIEQLPLPGLHIADIVCREISLNGWSKVALLGTKWTMTGEVYRQALEKWGFTRLIPSENMRVKINDAIFNNLCQGVFDQDTEILFVDTIENLRKVGAECVILGCTEIPLIINQYNSPIPVIDSTRLLAQYAVNVALSEKAIIKKGWIKPEI